MDRKSTARPMATSQAARELAMRATLDPADLFRITGYKRRQDQQRWLNQHGWVYSTNAQGELVVGRWYADQRLAGVIGGKPSGGLNLAEVR